MQSLTKTFPVGAAFAVAIIGGAAYLPGQVVPVPASPAAIQSRAEAPAVAPRLAQKAPAARRAVAQAVAPAAKSLHAAHAAVRSLLKFQTVRWGGERVETLDEPSRILLTKAAADKAGLADVGLSFHDVYGVIEAETS